MKLNWFTKQTGDRCLLQPNRYEVSVTHALSHKAYIDGELAPQVTMLFQNVWEECELKGEILGMPITFR